MKQERKEQLLIRLLQGGQRDNLRELAHVLIGVNICQDLVPLFQLINLIDHQDNGRLRLFQLLGDVALPRPDKRSGLNQPENHIHLLEGMLRGAHHILSQLIFRLMDARCIQKHDLSPGIRVYCPYLVTGGLGLIRSYGNLLPDQMVHQSRLSHIRPSHKGHKARFLLYGFFHNDSISFSRAACPEHADTLMVQALHFRKHTAVLFDLSAVSYGAQSTRPQDIRQNIRQSPYILLRYLQNLSPLLLDGLVCHTGQEGGEVPCTSGRRGERSVHIAHRADHIPRHIPLIRLEVFQICGSVPDPGKTPDIPFHSG